ncbi:hypothetical protein AB3S75_031324 [Citrus x aurantiifolia]
MGAIKAIEQDVTQRIKNVCEHMLKHNVIEVGTGVWVVAHAQLGSVAAKARQLDATSVILDMYGCRKLFF